MKQCFFPFVIILSFFLILCSPQEVFSGASDGLLLWFQIVLPTLLPFIILSNLLIYTNSISFFSRILSPALKSIFHISVNGSFAVMAGFLCGYPMGAKVTSDLTSEKLISKEEGAYLLSFCNNTSPMFIVSYIVTQNLKDKTILVPTVCILFLSPILCSYVFYLYYKHKFSHKINADLPEIHPPHFSFSILDKSIMNGFETITRVGGYIILFSVMISLLKNTPLQTALPLLEITNGIPMILKNMKSFATAYIYIMSLTSFGGFCSVAQTKSMVQEAGLPILPYIIEKLITALVTSLFAFLYVKFILPLQ